MKPLAVLFLAAATLAVGRNLVPIIIPTIIANKVPVPEFMHSQVINGRATRPMPIVRATLRVIIKGISMAKTADIRLVQLKVG